MPYTKILKSSFIASNHYSQISKNTFQHSFSFYSETIQRKQKIKKIHPVNQFLKYKDYLQINKMHVEYFKELKKGMSNDAFLGVLYKAELTGAIVEICGKKGIIVEERANSIRIIFENDSVKMYFKNVNNFIIEFDGVKYLFFGQNLAKNRFLKK
ncbi:hypothetical protein GVAV_000850 [Gurleya vavrai]